MALSCSCDYEPEPGMKCWQAGEDAGKVLGALLHNVYDKTGGFPSMAEGM